MSVVTLTLAIDMKKCGVELKGTQMKSLFSLQLKTKSCLHVSKSLYTTNHTIADSLQRMKLYERDSTIKKWCSSMSQVDTSTWSRFIDENAGKTRQQNCWNPKKTVPTRDLMSNKKQYEMCCGLRKVEKRERELLFAESTLRNKLYMQKVLYRTKFCYRNHCRKQTLI